MTKFICLNRPRTAGPQGAQGLLGATGTAEQAVAGGAPEGGPEGDHISKCNRSKVTCITELHDVNILNKNYKP